MLYYNQVLSNSPGGCLIHSDTRLESVNARTGAHTLHFRMPLSRMGFGFFCPPAADNCAIDIHSKAQAFSSRINASSSGVKSFLMLNSCRICSGVFPMIILATVMHKMSISGLMSR